MESAVNVIESLLREGEELVKAASIHSSSSVIDGKGQCANYSNLCERVSSLATELAQIQAEISDFNKEKAVSEKSAKKREYSPKPQMRRDEEEGDNESYKDEDYEVGLDYIYDHEDDYIYDHDDDLEEHDSDDDDEDEDEDEEEMETGGLSYKLICLFTIFVLFISIVLLFYRDSRPKLVDSILSPIDDTLSTQQEWVDSSIKSFKKFFGINTYGSLTKNSGKGSFAEWSIFCNQVSLTVAAQELELESKKAELKALKAERNKFLGNAGRIKVITDQINQNISEIKLKSMMEFEESFKATYQTLYNTAVLRSLRNDLLNRSEKVRKTKHYTARKMENSTSQYYRPINKFLRMSNLKESTIFSAIGTDHATDGTIGKMPIDFFKRLKLVNNSNTVPIEAPRDSREIYELEKQIYDRGNETEKYLFRLKIYNHNYYDKIQEIFAQLRVYEEFLSEFGLDELARADAGKIRSIHLSKQLERISRLKQVNDPRSTQVDLVKFSIKQKLLKVCTEFDTVQYDTIKFLESNAINSFRTKFSNWYGRLGRDDFKDDLKYMFQALSDRSARSKSFNLEKTVQLFIFIDGCLPNRKGIWMNQIYDYFTFYSPAIFPDSVVFEIVSYISWLLRLDPTRVRQIDLKHHFNCAKIPILSDDHRVAFEALKKSILN